MSSKISIRGKDSFSIKNRSNNQFSLALRNRLWNIISRNYFPYEILLTPLYKTGPYYSFIYEIYDLHFKEDTDIVSHERFQTVKHFQGKIKSKYYHLNSKGICAFLEFIITNDVTNVDVKKFVHECNLIFRNAQVDYHLFDKKIVRTDSELEKRELEYAASSPYTPVSQHLIAASILLYDDSPSYRNSIKESISAIESLLILVTKDPKSSFSKGMNKLAAKFKLSPVLKSAFEKLYGYTSSEGGIRHAMTASSSVDEDDARFMLIICIAFTNYVIRKNKKYS